jgi:hypothetical protein
MRKLLLFLAAALALAFATHAQTYNLRDTHGVTPETGDRTLAEVHGTVATSMQKMPDLWGWARAHGWSDAEVLSLRLAEAAWHDIFWRAERGNYTSEAPGHAVNIVMPNGRYGITYPLPFAQGIYSGEGSRFSDTYNGGAVNYGSTELYLDTGAWKSARSVDRIILRSANWGQDKGDAAWSHHSKIERFHFNGMRRSHLQPFGAEEYAGVACWDCGETSVVRDCYFANWDRDGILFVRGTPVHVENCSFFTCNRYGIALIGGGSFTGVNISGDESGNALVGGGPGYGRPGASRISIFGAKQETSTSAQFRPWQGSAFVHFDGWLRLTAHGVNYGSSWTNPYCFIHVNPTVNRSSIEVSGIAWFNQTPKLLIYDEAANKEYHFVGDAWFGPVDHFRWDQNEGIRCDWATIPVTTRSGPKGRLQHVGPDGAESWATAKIRTWTADAPTPPQPCIYTLGPWSEWSTCTNGQQTRTRTVQPQQQPCTGTPPATTESRACTVPPPPVSCH